MITKRKTEQRFYDKRDALIAKGVVTSDGQRFVFHHDYLFRTPSGASTCFLNGTSNGWVD